MGKKITPAVILDGAIIGGAFEAAAAMFGSTDPTDFRKVSLRFATMGVFDARGKKLTLPFFEGARFESLQIDDTTEIYDDEGNRVDADVRVIQDGEYQMLDFDPLKS